MKEIKPSKNNIKYWINTLVPQYDVFFFRLKPKFKNIEIMTLSEYLFQYDNINYNNAYCHWLVKKQAKYVIVDKNNWFLQLNEEDQKKILLEQIHLERGLIIEDCNGLSSGLEKFKTDNRLVITNYLLKSLKTKDQKELVYRYAKEQDDWLYEDIIFKDSKLNKIANKFINNEGTNCLAIVLYCITKNKKYLSSWVDRKEFEENLLSYSNVCDDNLENGDIICFYDNDNNIQHACFNVAYGYCLNKSGQSKYNPIVTREIEDIKQDWEGLKIVVKRKLC